MNRLTIAALLSCALLAAQSKLLPVDESSSDPEFSKFYQTFRTAVTQKDSKFLIAILDPEVQSEIDGDRGPQAFEKRWKTGSAESKVWTELAAIAVLGGSFSTEQGIKTFCAPYTYSKFPDAIDSFEHGVILGGNVPLRAKPTEEASIVARLSHDIVKVPDWKPSGEGQWVRVIARAGTGYVRKTDVRSPTDFRACFNRKGGKWLLRWLVAGD